MPAHHHWARKLLHDFEENPRTQVKFHYAAMIFWIINLLVGTSLLILAPHLWLSIGVFYVFALSIYANWDTDYGAVSAAQSSMHGEFLVQQQNRPAVQVTVDSVPEEDECL